MPRSTSSFQPGSSRRAWSGNHRHTGNKRRQEDGLDFTLTEEQQHWQQKARTFAEEDRSGPIALARDRITGPRDTFDWDIVRKGSQLGFRTAVVMKEFGGHGIDMITQALVMTELAKGDSAMSKTFSQCWKWSHLIAAQCSADQQERFLKAFVADDTFLLGFASTEPNGGGTTACRRKTIRDRG